MPRSGDRRCGHRHRMGWALMFDRVLVEEAFSGANWSIASEILTGASQAAEDSPNGGA